MYDTLTTSYTFACPIHGETHVRLSRFLRLEELPGAHHPSVYRVEFACGCGGEHPGLLTHDDLDWAPLGLQDGTSFVNLMTSRVEALGVEHFGQTGTIGDLYRHHGIDANAIIDAAESLTAGAPVRHRKMAV